MRTFFLKSTFHVLFGISLLSLTTGCSKPSSTASQAESEQNFSSTEDTKIPNKVIEQEEITATSQCSEAFIKKLLEPATSATSVIELNCSVKIPKKLDGTPQRITKIISMHGAGANGVTLDCNGAILESNLKVDSAMIWIRSKKNVDPITKAVTWSRPENITVKNCRINGTARVVGIWPTDLDGWKASSRKDQQHTQRAQAAAPKNIQMLNIDLKTVNDIPLYITPGVTYFRLMGSRITGVSKSVAIYLDAESAYNVIKNNFISVDTPRELIAVDGSALNTISGNFFSHLEDGGIFLYRNCGEDGVVRHQPPHHNHLINNVFYYDKYDGTNPAIWVASRNGNRKYCDDDKGYPFGSSSDDRDLATDNTLYQNQIYKRSLSDAIKVSFTPNNLHENITVTSQIVRKSGCFLDSGHVYLKHSRYLPTLGSNGAVTCPTTQRKCIDGEIERSVLEGAACTSYTTVPFSCRVEGSNEGCAKWAVCPAGKKAVSIRAGCNLEYGPVTSTHILYTPWNGINVVVPSDTTDDGHCRVGDVTFSSGFKPVDPFGVDKIAVGCWERDNNGGDCEIAGQLLCAPM